MGLFEYCNICLQTDNILISVNDFDNNKIKWSNKIKFILPELEPTDDYSICKNCAQKLDDFSEFKKLLVKLLETRKNGSKSIQNIILQKDCSDNLSDDQSKSLSDCDNITEPIINLRNNQNDDEYTKEKLKSDFCTESREYLSVTGYITKSEISISKIDSKDYQCNMCHHLYTTHENLQNHKQNCTSDFSSKELTIQQVDKKVQKKDKDLTLLRRPRGRKTKFIVSCETCGATFNYIKHLLDHCAKSHLIEARHVKPYKCSHCENRFTTHTTLNQHLKYHEKKRSEICTICGKTFITANDLLVHEYTHLNKRNYKCTQCDKAFNTNKNLRTHILVVHTDRSLWKYSCSVCGKSFPLKVNFDQHCRRHNGEKFHVCHFCGKSFVSNSELKRHVELHSNIKLFRCIPCNKDYKSRRTYKVHMDSKHSNGQYKAPIREKKFICHICPSQFYDKPKLLRHLCSHSGLKPFGCSICGKRFTDKSYLKHHVKITHKVVETALYSSGPIM